MALFSGSLGGQSAGSRLGEALAALMSGKKGGKKPDLGDSRPGPTDFTKVTQPHRDTLMRVGLEDIGRQEQAQEQNIAQAQGLSADMNNRFVRGQGRLEGLDEDIQSSTQDTLRGFNKVAGQAADLPGATRQQVYESEARFGRMLDERLGTITERADQALGDVMKGHEWAMQSAVQGIQGNVNNQVAQINADPNLSPTQRQQMISQVRMQGSMQLAPAVGQTILAFNTLQAQTATQLTNTIASAQTAAMGLQGQMATAGMTQITGAQTASAQLGTEIQKMMGDTRQSSMAMRSTVEGLRQQAINSNDQNQLALLPHREQEAILYSPVYQQDVGMALNAFQMDMAERWQDLGFQYMMQMQQQAKKDSMVNNLFGLAQAALGLAPGLIGL